jgi:hypothetical protein
LNFSYPCRLALILLSITATTLVGQETVVLSNEKGASALFIDGPSGWRWTQLTTPATPDGLTLTEGELRFIAGERTDTLNSGWTLTANSPARVTFENVAPGTGLGVRRVFSFGPASNVVRVETWLRSLDEPKLMDRIGLVSLRVEGEQFQLTGPAPASFPVFGQRLFAGVEDVCAESRAEGDVVRLWQTPDLSVGIEWQLIAAVVVGWHAPREAPFLPGESRTRDAFLQYLDTVSVKPQGINLHSDTWWTLPLPFTEADVLKDIAALRKGFFERTGMFFDTYALDLGWSDPQTLWRIDERSFPDGLHLIQEKLAELKCRMGMWVSPGSGYAPGLDNKWLEAQGYEMTPVSEDEKVACFAIGGRYHREFTETVVGYAKEYSLGHVIFDGLMHRCDEASHLHATGVGSTYAIAAGLRDVMDRLRQLNPRIVLEPLNCGHPPSPWWNMHTPYLLAPAGDDVPFGRVPCPDWTESLISARDIAYRSGQEKWLVRTQALETFDIIVQSPGAFPNMAALAAGRGRWFMSANIRPELMQPEDWDFLAGVVRWQRANQRFITDARMFGGSPENREAYGYQFHHAEKDIYCIRNPWMEERAISLPARVREARDLRTIYPRRVPMGRLLPDVDGPTIVLGPYETMFLETVPAADGEAEPAQAALSRAVIEADAPEVTDMIEDEEQAGGLQYHWRGAVSLPEIKEAELCILVEGPPEVADTIGSVRINGRPVALARKGSAGMFGAAVDASPENWTWFTAPVSSAELDVDLILHIPLEKASVGVFMRGAVSVHSDEIPEGEVAFPVHRPNLRPWSHTLQPLKAFVSTRSEAPSP